MVDSSLTIFDSSSSGPPSAGTGPVILDARVVAGSGGGPEKTILNSARYLSRYGYRTICAYMRSPRDAAFASIEQKARELEAPLVAVDDYGPLDYGIVARLADVCRRERVTIWHGHDYKSNLLGLLLRRSCPMRLVTTVHGWVLRSWKTPLYYALDRWSLPYYERVICVSEDLRQVCLRAGVREDRCPVIANGVDVAQFARTRSVAEAKQRLGWPAQGLLIGGVGRLSPEKGFSLLIEAVGELIREGLDLHLMLVGEGGERAALQSLIAARGLDGRVRLLGQRADVVELYEAMDAFVLSSLREGLPNVVLEAMAMGVPVLATEVAGVPALVEHAVNGLCIPPGSASALRDGLRTLVLQPALRRQLAETARQTVEGKFSFAARMERIHQIYQEVLASDGSAQGPGPGRDPR